MDYNSKISFKAILSLLAVFLFTAQLPSQSMIKGSGIRYYQGYTIATYRTATAPDISVGTEFAYFIDLNIVCKWDRTNNIWVPTDNILSQSGVPVHTPSTGDPFSYLDKDTGNLYKWNGASWALVGSGDASVVVSSITNVKDTSVLSPTTGDEFVNATGDTSGVYSTGRWLVLPGLSTTIIPGTYTVSKVTVQADGRITTIDTLQTFSADTAAVSAGLAIGDLYILAAGNDYSLPTGLIKVVSPVAEIVVNYLNTDITYASTIDNISDLSAKVTYLDTITNAPIVVVMHGFSQEVNDFDSAAFHRMANYGTFNVFVEMRGRGTSGGTEDAGAREIYDIYDAVEHVKTAYSQYVDTNYVYIVGYSGGGANALSFGAKFPDYVDGVINFFGISDYGVDATNGWYQQGFTVVSNFVDCAPAGCPDDYLSRSPLYSIGENYYGNIYIYHDIGDGQVPVIHSNRLIDTLALYGNASVVDSITTAAPRWTHTLPVAGTEIINAEPIFWDSLKQKVWSVDSVANIGSLDVGGYVKTSRFEVRLSVLDDEFVDLDYDLTGDTIDFQWVSRTGTIPFFSVTIPNKTPSTSYDVTINDSTYTVDSDVNGIIRVPDLGLCGDSTADLCYDFSEYVFPATDAAKFLDGGWIHSIISDDGNGGLSNLGTQETPSGAYNDTAYYTTLVAEFVPDSIDQIIEFDLTWNSGSVGMVFMRTDTTENFFDSQVVGFLSGEARVWAINDGALTATLSSATYLNGSMSGDRRRFRITLAGQLLTLEESDGSTFNILLTYTFTAGNIYTTGNLLFGVNTNTTDMIYDDIEIWYGDGS